MRVLALVLLLFVSVDVAAQGIVGGALGRSVHTRTIPPSTLRQGLQAWISCDEGTTGTRVDSHGANDLTDVNTNVASAVGLVSNACDFDEGTNFSLQSTASAWDWTTQDITLAFWMNPNSVETIKSVFGLETKGWRLLIGQFYGGNAAAHLRKTDDSAFDVAEGNASNLLSTFSWHFVVISFDQSTDQWCVEIDESDAPSCVVHTGAQTFGGPTFGLGAVPDATVASFNGLVDEIVLYHRILTDTEQGLLHNGGVGIGYADTGGGGPAPPSVPGAPTLALDETLDGTLSVTITAPTSGGTPTGYEVHWGTATGTYTNSLDVQTNLNPTISGLTNATQYFLIAKAYNTGGTSANSNEIDGTPTAPAATNCTTPDFTGTTYASMRAQAGTGSQTFDLTGALIAGCFQFSSSDPNALGDDGGIVIAASGGGFWVRHIANQDASAFISTTDPIELDWYEVADQVDITTLWANLANAYTPNFYIQMPTTAMTLPMGNWRTSDAAPDVTRVQILESTAAVTLKQTSTTEPWIRFGTMDDLIIGTATDKARDSYLLTFEGRATSTSYAGLSYNTPMILWSPGYQENKNIDVHLRFNTLNAYANGFGKTGLAWVDNIYAEGRHVHSSVEFSDFGYNFTANKNIILDLYISDPYGAGYGWNGSATGATVTGKWSKWRGLRIGGADHITGALELQYGWTGLRSFFANKWGTSGSPFVLTVKDEGFLGPESGFDGEDLEPSDAILNNAIKWDGQLDGTDNVSNQRYVKVVEDNAAGTNADILTVFVESNACDDSGSIDLIMSYFDVTLTNLQEGWTGTAAGSNVDLCDNRIHDWTFRGDGVNPASVSGSEEIRHAADNLVFRDGTFHTIDYAKPGNVGDVGVQTAGNFGINLTLTGNLEIDTGVDAIELQNVDWTGTAREVMSIPTGTTVTVKPGWEYVLTAPSTSTIAGTGTLNCNGSSVSLPYTFTGSGVCESSTIAIPAQAAWSAPSAIVAEGATETTNWDWDISGSFTPSTVIERGDTLFLWYTGANTTRADGGPANRKLGLAYSTNGTSWTKDVSSPRITHQPDGGHGNVEEEGTFSGAGFVDPTDNRIVMLFGGMQSTSADQVDSDGVLTVSEDGFVFGSQSDALNHASSPAGYNDELFPVGVYKSGSTYHLYWIGKGGTGLWDLVHTSSTDRTNFTAGTHTILCDASSGTSQCGSTGAPVEFKAGANPVQIGASTYVIPVGEDTGPNHEIHMHTGSGSSLVYSGETYSFANQKEWTMYLDADGSVSGTPTWYVFYILDTELTGNQDSIQMRTAPVTYE